MDLNCSDDTSAESASTEPPQAQTQPNGCFFCNKLAIKRKGRKIHCRMIKNKKAFLEKTKTYATELGDLDFLCRIQEELNSDSTWLCYHNNCSLDYFAKYQNKMNARIRKKSKLLEKLKKSKFKGMFSDVYCTRR